MADLVIRLQADKPFGGLTNYFLINLGREILALHPEVPLEFEYQHIHEQN